MKAMPTHKSRRARSLRRDPNRYPPGLNRRKVEAIIAHYERQTEDQAVAEDEAAYRNHATTMMGVPVALGIRGAEVRVDAQRYGKVANHALLSSGLVRTLR